MKRCRNLSEKAYARGYQIGRLEIKGRISDNAIRDWHHVWCQCGYGDAFDAGRAAPVIRDNVLYRAAWWTPAQQRYFYWRNRGGRS